MNKIILASLSRSRRDLLVNAGLKIDCIPSGLDENPIKDEGLPAIETASKLAQAKAAFISVDHPECYTIGADQMMECDGICYDKPSDKTVARKQLLTLRGKTHRLISAVAVYRGEECLWTHHQIASLEMRDFSDDFLDRYLDTIGDEVLETVGGYRLESLGVQLFKRIEGDYFTILGLPLLPLLDFLRTQRIVSL